MNFPEFDSFQKLLFAEIVVNKDTKGKEYANGVDRFSNFKRAADDLGLTPEQVCWVYTKKHLDSIAHFCKVGHIESTEPIRGRFVDAICYLSLMAGIIEEKNERRNLAKNTSETRIKPGLSKKIGDKKSRAKRKSARKTS